MIAEGAICKLQKERVKVEMKGSTVDHDTFLAFDTSGLTLPWP